MAEPVAAEGIKYITKSDLDEAIRGLNTRFDSRLDSFKNELLQVILRDVDAKIEASAKKSIQQMEDLLDRRVEDEAQKRKDDVERVKQQITDVSEETRQQLSDLNEKFEPVISKVNKMIGKLEAWSSAMDSNQQLFSEAKKDFRAQAQATEKIRDDIDIVQNIQTTLGQNQKVLRHTIHGNTSENGAPSIYSTLSSIENAVGELKDLAKDNSSRLTSIEREQAAQKKKWADRWETAKSLLKSKQFWGIVALSIMAIAVVVRPETQDFFLQLPLINLFFEN